MADLSKALRKWTLVWRIRLTLWVLRSRKWIGIALAAGLALFVASKRKSPAGRSLTSKQRDDALIADAVLEARVNRSKETATALAKSSAAHEKAGAEAALGIRKAGAKETEAELKAYAKRVREVAKLWPIVFFFLAALACPIRTFAQAEPFALEHPTTHASGFWVPDDVTRSLLADAANLVEIQKALKDARDAQAALFIVIDSQDAKLRADLDVMSSLRFDAERAQADASAAKAKLSAWYRRPAFLIGIGIAAGLIVPTVIVVAVQ